ncbi:nuclear distribution protein pac1-2 [Lasiosphaeris hirsuta]|uniref:Nuclear distribution protein PAC1 n=1 Tax=Lasiosphaeris hirsuta TaxID=260670 RepID=A0AA40DY29_9PEZI|nr:nuclear distribution protein pac1-2 [Lasiosphaeris hirsuta]
MAQILTSRQAEELHKSIIAYLSSKSLSHTAAALRAELGIGEDSFDAEKAKKYEGLLEKKWTSVVRLQKKILDLETRNSTLQSELESATPSSLSRRNQDPVNWLPKAPPRYVLESHRLPVTCVAFHPVFTSLASGSEDYTIKIWDWELGELERTIKGHTKAVLDIDFGGPRGGTLLASCSSDLTIKLWDPSDGYKNIRTLPGHDHIVSSIRFIPSGAAGAPASGNLLVSASKDNTLKIWDVTTGYCVKTIYGHTDWPRAVCPSFDGRYILSTGSDKSVRLWDLSAREPECKLVLFGHENFNLCCAFAPPSSYEYLAKLAGLEKAPPASSSAEFMATGSRDKQIRLWDSRGNCVKVLAGHDNWVRGLVFHPGGRYLISVADDRTLRCWDLSQDAKCVQTLTGVYEGFVSCIRWAPDIVKDAAANGATADGADGTPKKKTGDANAASNIQIRCVVATGSVDGPEGKVRIFAN